MELKIILSLEEQKLLDVDEAEFSDADAIHLLFSATEKLARNSECMNELRGRVAGQPAQFNRTWHENSVLSDLVNGLERITGTGTEGN